MCIVGGAGDRKAAHRAPAAAVPAKTQANILSWDKPKRRLPGLGRQGQVDGVAFLAARRKLIVFHLPYYAPAAYK